MKRIGSITALIFLLSACGASFYGSALFDKALMKEYYAQAAQCDEKHPLDKRKHAMANVQCNKSTFNRLSKEKGHESDILVNTYFAEKLVIAEKFSKKKLSVAEYNAQLAQLDLALQQEKSRMKNTAETNLANAINANNNYLQQQQMINSLNRPANCSWQSYGNYGNVSCF